MGSGHNRGGRGNNRRPRNGPPPHSGRGPQHGNGPRNGQPAVTAISSRSHQAEAALASNPAATSYEAELDIIEVDEVAAVELDGAPSGVEVRQVTASLRVEAEDPTVAELPPPAASGAIQEITPPRSDTQYTPPPQRGQRQPYVPAMSAGRQGPPPARPHAPRPMLVANPAETRRPTAPPAAIDVDGGSEGASQPLPAVRPRPERFSATDRPHREHGERYQPTPGTPDIRGEVGSLIDSLRSLFQEDRTMASQNGVTRCGICYFHFPLATLSYREDGGFYICYRCEKALGGAALSMVRRQQRF